MTQMSDKELQALRRLIKYVADDQIRDFSEDPRPNHIYREIYLLAKWLDLDTSQWPNPDKWSRGEA
jgi:hypothetical protein